MKCPYCDGEGVIAGMDGLEQCEMCGGESEVEDTHKKLIPKKFHRKEK